jgi:hypothetical protein
VLAVYTEDSERSGYIVIVALVVEHAWRRQDQRRRQLYEDIESDAKIDKPNFEHNNTAFLWMDHYTNSIVMHDPAETAQSVTLRSLWLRT